MASYQKPQTKRDWGFEPRGVVDTAFWVPSGHCPSRLITVMHAFSDLKINETLALQARGKVQFIHIQTINPQNYKIRRRKYLSSYTKYYLNCGTPMLLYATSKNRGTNVCASEQSWQFKWGIYRVKILIKKSNDIYFAARCNLMPWLKLN